VREDDVIDGAAGTAQVDDTTLGFYDPLGDRYEWTVRYGPAGSDRPDGRRTRPVTVAGGSVLVQHWVPRTLAVGSSPVLAALENEIRAGTRLARRYAENYPSELARLVGYDIDCPEPFLLLARPRGEPSAGSAGVLGLTALHTFQVALFRGLYMLAEAGIVHDGLDPETVRWDGTVAQLADFGSATLARERRSGRADSPWASPQRRADASLAVPGDDIWSAGLVVFHVATGRDVSTLAGPPDLAGRPALADLLAGVFAEQPADRPTAQAILHRLGAPAKAPPGQLDNVAAFAEGRREFDRLLAEKRADRSAPGPGSARAARPARGGMGLPARRALLTVAAVVVLVAVAAALHVGGFGW
jgi:hypothetical protein